MDQVLGPVLLGTGATNLLYGIMLVQCQTYFEQYRDDKRWVKALVWLLLAMNTLTTTFHMGFAYTTFVTRFGKTGAMLRDDFWVLTYPVSTGVTAFFVQGFFAWRVKTLIGSNLLAGVVLSFSLVQLCGSIGTTIAASIVNTRSQIERIRSISLTWLVGSLVTDLLITVSLVWYLQRSAKTGFASTDRVTGKITRLTIQTGFLTTTFALATLLSYLIKPAANWHLLFGLPLSHLYTNSLMSSLNARRGWGQDYLATELQTPLGTPNTTPRHNSLSTATPRPRSSDSGDLEFTGRAGQEHLHDSISARKRVNAEQDEGPI